MQSMDPAAAGRRFSFRRPFRRVADAHSQRAALVLALALMAATYCAELMQMSQRKNRSRRSRPPRLASNSQERLCSGGRSSTTEMAMSAYDPLADWSEETSARWVEHQGWLDDRLAPFGAAAVYAADVVRGERVLDIGCGAGATSLELARLVGPEGSVTGIDTSELLLAQARKRACHAGVAVRFVCSDATSAAFADAPFDLAFSRFAVMFFFDPVAALTRVRGALRSKGRIVFVCWRGLEENDWINLPLRAAGPLLSAPPPQDLVGPGQFAFADSAHVAAIFRGAGFRDVDVARFDARILLGRGATREAAAEDALHKACQTGALRRLLAEADEATVARAHDAIRTQFAHIATAEGVRLHAAAWIATARAS